MKNNPLGISDYLKKLLLSREEKNTQLAFQLCTSLDGNYSEEVAQLLRKHILLCFATGVERDYFFTTNSLDLSHTDLTNIPVDFSQFSQLRVLNLAYTGLTKVSPSIFQLPQLEVLNLEGNEQLQELPKGIKLLENLQELNLSGTALLEDDKQKIQQLLRNVKVSF